MLYEEVISYITKERATGISDDVIFKNLKTVGGFNQADIDTALKEIAKRTQVTGSLGMSDSSGLFGHAQIDFEEKLKKNEELKARDSSRLSEAVDKEHVLGSYEPHQLLVRPKSETNISKSEPEPFDTSNIHKDSLVHHSFNLTAKRNPGTKAVSIQKPVEFPKVSILKKPVEVKEKVEAAELTTLVAENKTTETETKDTSTLVNSSTAVIENKPTVTVGIAKDAVLPKPPLAPQVKVAAISQVNVSEQPEIKVSAGISENLKNIKGDDTKTTTQVDAIVHSNIKPVATLEVSSLMPDIAIPKSGPVPTGKQTSAVLHDATQAKPSVNAFDTTGGQTKKPAEVLTPGAKPAKVKGSNKTLILVLLFVVLMGSVFIGVFYVLSSTLGVFASTPQTIEALALHLNQTEDEITKSKFAVTVKANTSPIENFPRIDLSSPDMSTLGEPDLGDAEIIEGLRDIRSALEFLAVNGVYPDSIETIDSFWIDEGTDLTKYVYEPVAEGSDYALSATFNQAGSLEVFERDETTTLVDVETKTVTLSSASSNFWTNPSSATASILESLQGLNEMALFMPGLFSGDLTLSGVFDIENTENTDTETGVNLDVEFGDLSFAFEAEARLKDNHAYVKVNRMPVLPFFGVDISPIRGQWIELNENDMQSYGGFGFDYETILDIVKESEEYETETRQANDTYQMVVGELIDQKVIAFKNSPRQAKSEAQAYTVYSFRMSPENMLPALVNIEANIIEMNDTFMQVDGQSVLEDYVPMLDLQTRTYLESQQFLALVEYLNTHGSSEMWLDNKTKLPARFVQELTLAPDLNQNGTDSLLSMLGNEGNINSKMTFAVDVFLTNINEAVSVQKPPASEVISLKKATMDMTGMSELEYDTNLQKDTIESLQWVLSQYEEIAGTYPESLDMLTQMSPRDLGVLEDEYYGFSAYDAPFIKIIPSDVFTGEAYGYAVLNDTEGNDFELTYVITLPEYDGSINQLFIRPNYTFFSIFEESESAQVTFNSRMEFVDGVNTATSSTLSLQADEQNAIDVDGNGVPDIIDEYVGRDPEAEVYSW